MSIILLFGLFLVVLFRKYVFFFVIHLKDVIYYCVKDVFNYFKCKKWKKWNGYGLIFYTGLFGKGKTLSATKYVISTAKRYKLNVISNISLKGIEYTPLLNYHQILDAEPYTIVFIDEISTLWNSREYKNFPMEVLFQMLQNRKSHLQLIGTAQRFEHIDKLLRDVTSYVVDCNKLWRFTTNTFYDAFMYENVNRQFLRCEFSKLAFITDTDYGAYDTNEIINNVKKTEFISNEEILEKRVESVYNPLKIGVKGTNRKFRRRISNKK